MEMEVQAREAGMVMAHSQPDKGAWLHGAIHSLTGEHGALVWTARLGATPSLEAWPASYCALHRPAPSCCCVLPSGFTAGPSFSTQLHGPCEHLSLRTARVFNMSHMHRGAQRHIASV